MLGLANVAFMVTMVAAMAPSASALLILTPFAHVALLQFPSPDNSHGKVVAGPEAVAPHPNASGNYHVGNGVSAPKIVFAADPEFTDKARRKKLDGIVVVSLIVDPTGNPQDVRVSRSLADGKSRKVRASAVSLDESAVKAVKEFRFEPGELEGKPVPVEIKIEVNYRIY